MREALNFGFQYIKRYKTQYILYIFLSIAISVLGIASPWILAQIVDLISGKKAEGSLEMLVAAFATLVVGQMLLGYANSYLYLKLQTKTGYRANIDTLTGLYKTSYCNIDSEDPAVLNQMINNDCNDIMIFALSFFKDILINCVSVLFIMVIIIRQSAVLAFIFGVLLLCYILIYMVFHKKLYEKSLEVRNRQAEFFGKLYGIVSELKSIKLNGFTETILKRQEIIFENYQKSMKKQLTMGNAYDFCAGMVSLMSQIVLFLYGGYLVLNSRMNLGIFVIVSNYFSNLISSANYFLNFGRQLQNVKACYDRLKKYITVPQSEYGDKKIEEVRRLTCRDVSFAYPKKQALFQIEKEFEVGKLYWLKGENGKGKTTFLHLLGGLFERDYAGVIEVDGRRVEEIDVPLFIKEHVAVVEQRPYILSDTFEQNIVCKCKKNKGSGYQEKEEEVLKALGLDELFERLSQGKYTEFNALMDNLSGGERQKIALARAFLSEAEIWFLDEPTAALDEESKKNFFKLLEKEKIKRMIFLISHEFVPIYDEVINF